jgi:hypothetical protein
MDFVENYNFQVQNEVQSIHWHSYYIIILVHITYQFNLDFDGYDKTLGFWWNIIFMSKMIISMILKLWNIFSRYIGSTYQTKDLNQIGIMLGLMGAPASSSLQKLGILY